MWIPHVTKDTFAEEVINATQPVLIDFYASWCGPCRMVTPVLEQIAEEQGDAGKIVRVDIDDQPELADVFEVMSVPTLFAAKDGQVTGVLVGVQPKAAILQLLGL